jgi:hypothetical protein
MSLGLARVGRCLYCHWICDCHGDDTVEFRSSRSCLVLSCFVIVLSSLLSCLPISLYLSYLVFIVPLSGLCLTIAFLLSLPCCVLSCLCILRVLSCDDLVLWLSYLCLSRWLRFATLLSLSSLLLFFFILSSEQLAAPAILRSYCQVSSSCRIISYRILWHLMVSYCI